MIYLEINVIIFPFIFIVADQLVARIFDQRQFTCGEINYLMRELGEKSNLEANFDKLLKINENVCLINDRNSGDMCQSGDPVAKDVSDKGKPPQILIHHFT